MIIYMVRPRDTLGDIARRFNSSRSAIIEANGLTEPDNLITGMTLVIPTKEPTSKMPKQDIVTLGYYMPYLDPNQTFLKHLGSKLTYLGYFDFPVTVDGAITGTFNPAVLKIAKEEDVSVLPVLTNWSDNMFNPQMAHDLLSNPVSVSNLINNILAMLNEYDFQGINIDFENLFPKDRQLFTSFIQKLYKALHNDDKILVINMAPKWEDWPDRNWVGFFDYNALGDYIDLAAIMTYEWGWKEGPPSATAPMPEVRRSLEYAMANNIPPDKILMGLTLYGYDWEVPNTEENAADTVTLPMMWEIARKYNVPIEFNPQAKQPVMYYTTEENMRHEAWFENALSHCLKYDLVREYGLRGTFYWLITEPLEATWYIVSHDFHVQKEI